MADVTVVFLGCAVSVSEAQEFVLLVSEGEQVCFGAGKVMEDMLDAFPVHFAQVFKELG